MEAKKAKARQARDAMSPDAQQLVGDQPDSKRMTHNGIVILSLLLTVLVLERKRRNDLKASYQDLRETIPELAQQERAPTAQILQKAVEYIENLKKADEQFASAVAALRAENERLRAAYSHH